MKPGRELDKLVAGAMGWTNVDSEDYPGLGVVYRGFPPGKNISDFLPHYSADWAAAGQAWEWLEQNHPWRTGEWQEDICLGRNSTGQPSVIILEMQLDNKPNEYIMGQTYPHAIALAVVEAAKAKGTLT